MELSIKHETISSLFDYYIDQIFKILYLFEAKDYNGYKHSRNVANEVRDLIYVIPQLGDDYRYYRLIIKLEFLYDEMIAMGSPHRIIKNNVMESCNLLSDIKERVIDENENEASH